jgi:hypothetical protein
MTIRFLDLVESDTAGFPFMPGQVIDVPTLTPSLRTAIHCGLAELVRGEEPELATVTVPERAGTRRRKR